ncbi:tetratricopeptide repeat protein [Undibacterium cyanobacteriorum]|uniref:protein O-GlcNAc transferase n=1 Tax=Undibacterium cyanobacteriorum TaxID=3073561 RepID=A0ABY9RQ94_9BURK|nr:tetratricopeptide repeat protein [Undibacterium sp. 20NA77.5]WMW82151.1 tetratricopeptide repeat protein [Undibacterium sp. 20NA77.5]
MLNWLKSAFSKKPEQAHSATSTESPFDSKVNDLKSQANRFLDEQNYTEAARCYQTLLEKSPNEVAYLINLGFVLIQANRLEEAHAYLKQAKQLDAKNIDVHFNLGQLEEKRSRNEAAISHYQAALNLAPDFDFCRQCLCALLINIGDFHQALKRFEQRPFLATNSLPFHLFKAQCYSSLQQHELAIEHYEQALIQSPDNQSLQLHLACAFMRVRQLDRAEQLFNAILQVSPSHGEARGFLASCLQLRGDVELACEQYKQVITQDPQQLTAHQNYLYALSYNASISADFYLQEARDYAGKLRQRVEKLPPRQVSPNTDSPLRIGFVSGDLRGHPVGLFLRNVLKHLHSERFHCIAYANQLIEDSISQELKSYFLEWHGVAQLSDQALAQKIADDKIDILIDLAGHTEHNRLAVFCAKPAPIQIAWLGYWASTGVDEIDYILVDKVSVPEADTKQFCEKPLYFSATRLCMSEPKTAIELKLSTTPALLGKPICYGTFQTPNKLTDASIALWSRVLLAQENSVLRLQNSAFDHESSKQALIAKFARHGIPSSRLRFVGGMSYSDYLAAHAEVDFILDTHPFPGGTTTTEAIWMGVPTLTLQGHNLLSRQGESMLTCVGLKDWIASDENDFVRIACEKSSQLVLLNQCRQTLRQRAKESPLFNAQIFAKELESLLEQAVRDSKSISE